MPSVDASGCFLSLHTRHDLFRSGCGIKPVPYFNEVSGKLHTLLFGKVPIKVSRCTNQTITKRSDLGKEVISLMYLVSSPSSCALYEVVVS